MPVRPRPTPARRRVAAAAVALAALLGVVGPADAVTKASHDGWPVIDGALLINKGTESRPLDARPGADPFMGTDSTYRCDGDHQFQGCFIKAAACLPHPRHTNRCAGTPVFPLRSVRHNELLGGGGDDVIHAGDGGDVIWGDHRYPDNPVTQHDKLFGGAGDDFIYASHGLNEIHTGGGRDKVFARYGRGVITCDSPTVRVNLSRRSKKRYTLVGCGAITLKPIGTREYPG